MDMNTDRDTNEASVHAECRSCGQNLSTEADECPVCGAGVAEYSLD